MAEDIKQCPTCHSYIADDLTPANRVQGAIDSGESVEITDPFEGGNRSVSTSTSKAVPQWTEDPTLTLRGFSGPTYVGSDHVRAIHIRELQYARIAEEQESGIAEPTVFSDIDGEHIRKVHIIELRESTEKLLNAVGLTLEEYFKLDINQVEKSPGPNDENKQDWTDVERGAPYLHSDGTFHTEFQLPNGQAQPSPSFPDSTHVRAIHVEDLRHPLFVGIQAVLISQKIIVNQFNNEIRKTRILEALKDGKAGFKKAKECTVEE